MKKCPYCAEEIQDAAIKCRYCLSDLTTVKTANEAESKQDKLEPKVPPIEVSKITEQPPQRPSPQQVTVSTHQIGTTDEESIAILKSTITKSWLNETPGDGLIRIYKKAQLIDARRNSPDAEFKKTLNTLLEEIKKRGLPIGHSSQEQSPQQRTITSGGESNKPKMMKDEEKTPIKNRWTVVISKVLYVIYVIFIIGLAKTVAKSHGHPSILGDVILIILVCFALVKGWKWWSLLPPAILFGFAYIWGYAYTSAGGNIKDQKSILVVLIVTLICYAVLGVMIFLKRKTVGESTTLKQSEPLKMSNAGSVDGQTKLREIWDNNYIRFIAALAITIAIFILLAQFTKREEPASVEAPKVEAPVEQPEPPVEAPVAQPAQTE